MKEDLQYEFYSLTEKLKTILEGFGGRCHKLTDAVSMDL